MPSPDNRKRGVLAAVLLVLMTFGSPALAQRAKMPPEHVISYQASLTDLDGKPIANGVYEIFASLYSDPEGLSLVWRSNYRVEAKAGIINLTLGEVLDGGVPLPDSGLDGPLYLGIRIMGDPITGATASEELRPLTRLSASLNALSVADNSVTKSKLAADYVEHIVINGDTISGKASTLDLRAGSGILMTKD
ncbi:MAG TPA: hypothetical protein VEF04_08495, partial [Blastocatellia bacterium]|nr:hypothetical protein [Blastocatellia bacterium]